MPRSKTHEEVKKITFNAPADLVSGLLKDSDENLTEMLVRLMKEERRQRAWKQLAAMRGKITFDETWEKIKEARK